MMAMVTVIGFMSMVAMIGVMAMIAMVAIKSLSSEGRSLPSPQKSAILYYALLVGPGLRSGGPG